MKLLEKNADLGLLILRLSLGSLMLLHGIGKLIHGVGGIGQMLESMGLPSFIAYGAYVGEVIAPLLIIFGYRTRIAAAIFAFNMVVAIAMAHLGEIFTLNAVGGWAVELPGLYLFGAVALVFTGAGKYAFSHKSLWD